MKNKDCDSLEKARNYSFLLLKFRLRSRREIGERLRRKKFSQDTIEKTVSFLEDKGFINDGEFARAWIATRISRPLGLRRLRQELKAKGIDEKIIESNIQGLKDNYSEMEIVREIAEEKFDRLKGIEPQKAKKRIYDYLFRRGFSPDVVIDVIKNL